MILCNRIIIQLFHPVRWKVILVKELKTVKMISY